MTLKLVGRVSALATSLDACATTGEITPMTPLVPAAPATAPATDYVNDAHSYARPAEARVTHVDLDLAADFAAKTLSGKATLDVTGRPGATEVVLDAKMLDIKGVTDAQGRALQWSLGASDPIKGQPLTVRIPAFQGGET